MTNKLFLFDRASQTEYTYSGLFYSLNNSTDISKIIHSGDYFEIFRNKVSSLTIGCSLLIDNWLPPLAIRIAPVVVPLMAEITSSNGVTVAL